MYAYGLATYRPYLDTSSKNKGMNDDGLQRIGDDSRM